MLTITNNNEEQILEAANHISQKFKESKKENIVIVNIGTDRIVGDAFGPLLGSMLVDLDTPFKIYGTLDSLLTSKNANAKIEEILDNHTNSFIIATDAGLTSKEELLDTISIRDIPLKPALANDKELSEIGDMSILYNLAIPYDRCKDDGLYFSLQSIRISKIYHKSKIVISLLNTLKNLLD